jgi:hypothetical protein
MITIRIPFAIVLILLAKFSFSQTNVLAGLIHTEGDTEALAIAADNAGNIIIGGQVSLTTDFDTNSDAGIVEVIGDDDGYVCKRSPDGSFQWVYRIGGDETSTETVYDIAIDAEGFIYVAGNFSNNCDFDPSDQVAQLYGALTDGYLLKIAPDGTFVWVREISSSGADRAYGVVINNAGDILLCGFLSSQAYIGTPDNLLGDFDGGFVCSFTSDGTLNWTRVIEAPSTCTVAKICIGPDDSVYGTGIFSSTFDLDPGIGVQEVTSLGDDDGFYFKLDAAGNFVYGDQFGSVAKDWAYAIAVNNDGEAFVTGVFEGDLTLGSGGNALNIPYAGNRDGLIFKLNNDGTPAWAKGLGDSSNQRGTSVKTDNQGNPVCSGYFSGTIDTSSEDGVQGVSASDSDHYIIQLDQEGNLQYACSVSGDGVQRAEGLFIGDNNTIYASGYSSGAIDLDPGAGEQLESTTSSSTYFVRFNWENSNQIHESEQPLAMYPNPLNTQRQQLVSHQAGYLRIFDSGNKLVLDYGKIRAHETLQLNLNAGVYYFEMINNDTRIVQRIVVMD